VVKYGVVESTILYPIDAGVEMWDPKTANFTQFRAYPLHDLY